MVKWNRCWQVGIIPVLIILAFLDSFWRPPLLPWRFNILPMALLLMIAGYWLHPLLDILFRYKRSLLLALAFMIVGIAIAFLNAENHNGVFLSRRQYNNIFLLLLSAFATTVAFSLFAGFRRLKWLEFLGRNTVTILGLHMCFILAIQHFLGRGVNVWMSAAVVGSGALLLSVGCVLGATQCLSLNNRSRVNMTVPAGKV